MDGVMDDSVYALTSFRLRRDRSVYVCASFDYAATSWMNALMDSWINGVRMFG